MNENEIILAILKINVSFILQVLTVLKIVPNPLMVNNHGESQHGNARWYKRNENNFSSTRSRLRKQATRLLTVLRMNIFSSRSI